MDTIKIDLDMHQALFLVSLLGELPLRIEFMTRFYEEMESRHPYEETQIDPIDRIKAVKLDREKEEWWMLSGSH
jgi:hypothetical protein